MALEERTLLLIFAPPSLSSHRTVDCPHPTPAPPFIPYSDKLSPGTGRPASGRGAFLRCGALTPAGRNGFSLFYFILSGGGRNRCTWILCRPAAAER